MVCKSVKSQGKVGEFRNGDLVATLKREIIIGLVYILDKKS